MLTKHPTSECIGCDLCESSQTTKSVHPLPGLALRCFPDLVCMWSKDQTEAGLKVLSRQGMIEGCRLPRIKCSQERVSWIRRNVINNFKQLVFTIHLSKNDSTQNILAVDKSGLSFMAITQTKQTRTKYPTQLWIM